MTDVLTKTIDLKTGNAKEKRQEILEYFRKTWAVDEQLYTQLKSDEVFYHRGDPLRHVLLFYFGHTAVFFINKLFKGDKEAYENTIKQLNMVTGYEEGKQLIVADLANKYNWKDKEAIERLTEVIQQKFM